MIFHCARSRTWQQWAVWKVSSPWPRTRLSSLANKLHKALLGLYGRIQPVSREMIGTKVRCFQRFLPDRWDSNDTDRMQLKKTCRMCTGTPNSSKPDLKRSITVTSYSTKEMQCKQVPLVNEHERGTIATVPVNNVISNERIHKLETRQRKHQRAQQWCGAIPARQAGQDPTWDKQYQLLYLQCNVHCERRQCKSWQVRFA